MEFLPLSEEKKESVIFLCDMPYPSEAGIKAITPYLSASGRCVMLCGSLEASSGFFLSCSSAGRQRIRPLQFSKTERRDENRSPFDARSSRRYLQPMIRLLSAFMIGGRSLSELIISTPLSPES